MHHIFEVDEILRFIASSITYEDLKDAVPFACCHKSFSAPTLDTIWGQYQRDFTRLLKTLPSSTWIIVDGNFVSFSPAQLTWHVWFMLPCVGLSPRAFGGGMGAAFCICQKDALFHVLRARCTL